MDRNVESLADSIDVQICDLAEAVRGAEGRMGIGSLFKLLQELDDTKSWRSLEAIWDKPFFNPIWRLAHPDRECPSDDEVAESVSFDSAEWGVHFDAAVFPDRKQGCRAVIRWSPDGKARSESALEDRLWTWENLNAVSRYFIGRAVSRNACGSRSCFEDWKFLSEQKPTPKE